MNRRGSNKILAFDKSSLKKDILKEAKLLNIPVGAANEIAEKVTTSLAAWADKRNDLARTDLDKRIVAELSKYSDDLAFIYQNRGKII